MGALYVLFLALYLWMIIKVMDFVRFSFEDIKYRYTYQN